MVRQIGSARNSFEVLVMHFPVQLQRSPRRTAHTWKFYRASANCWPKFCQPVYELWLADKSGRSRIATPAFFADDMVRAAWSRCLWTGDGPGRSTRQSGRRRKARRPGHQHCWSRKASCGGIDWEAKHRQRVVEVRARQSDGIANATPGP